MMLRTFMRHTDGLVLSFTMYFCKLTVFLYNYFFHFMCRYEQNDVTRFHVGVNTCAIKC